MKFHTLSCAAYLLALTNAFALPGTSSLVDSDAHKPQCDPKVVSLATGIHLNIQGQHAELAGTEKLQRIEADSPVNMTQLSIAKGELLADIAAGITIRKYNQAILPRGNAARDGLAKYAKAQGMEQKLVEGLKGKPREDRKTLATLMSDIHAGTMLNRENLRNATMRCRVGFGFPK